MLVVIFYSINMLFIRYKTRDYFRQIIPHLVVSGIYILRRKYIEMALKYPCIVTEGVCENSLAVSCDVYKKWCHISCTTTFSRNDYMQLKADYSDFDWLCDQCKREEEEDSA